MFAFPGATWLNDYFCSARALTSNSSMRQNSLQRCQMQHGQKVCCAFQTTMSGAQRCQEMGHYTRSGVVAVEVLQPSCRGAIASQPYKMASEAMDKHLSLNSHGQKCAQRKSYIFVTASFIAFQAEINRRTRVAVPLISIPTHASEDKETSIKHLELIKSLLQLGR